MLEILKGVDRRMVGLMTGAAATVALAGLAGWGGSTLAINAAADGAAASDAATRTSAAVESTPPSAASTASEPAPGTSTRSAAAASTKAGPGVVIVETKVAPAPAPAAEPADAEPVPQPAPKPAREPAPKPAPELAPEPEPEPEPQVDCSAYHFEVESNRVSRQAQTYNLNSEWNMALNSGDLDRAEEIHDHLSDLSMEWAEYDSALAARYPGC